MESNRLTIIPVDGAVYRDQQVFTSLSLSNCNIPANVHALQWQDGSGWIEFTDTRVNDPITELPQWAIDCVQVWETAYQAMIDAAANQAMIDAQANQPIIDEPAPE